MSEQIWVRIETAADGVHLHRLPPGIGEDKIQAHTERLMARYGIPADWIDNPQRGQPRRWANTPPKRGGKRVLLPATDKGWDVSLITGDPHPSLVEMATVHEEA